MMNFLSLLGGAAGAINFQLNCHSIHQRTQLCDRGSESSFHKVFPLQLEASLDANIPESTSEIDQILQERQKLINQYLQLNIQILEKEIREKETLTVQSSPLSAEHLSLEEDDQRILEGAKKKIKKTNNCGHDDRPHYAKGMCGNCYHRNGRVKKPWRCGHAKLYAAGLCQNCYTNDYNRKKRQEGKAEGRKEDKESQFCPLVLQDYARTLAE